MLPTPTVSAAGSRVHEQRGGRMRRTTAAPPQQYDDTTTSTGRPRGRGSQKRKEEALETTRPYYSAPSLNDLQIRDLARAHNSAPWNKPSLSNKPDLKGLHTWTECQQLITELAEEVNDIKELKHCRKRGLPAEGVTEPDSLESSRAVILGWAQELDSITMLKNKTSDDRTKGTIDLEGRREKSVDKDNERLQRWATELMNVKEANGLSDEDLKRLLCPRGQKESRLSSILPLLEFVAWSLLSHNTEEAISKVWLPTKQKAWRTGKGAPKYIPNSVWQWILNASVSVRLDPATSHPWLLVSTDRLQVREAPQLQSTTTTSSFPVESPSCSQRFDGWPCVLGEAPVINTGRHYWQVQVDVSSSSSSPSTGGGGAWRIGVAAVSAPRSKRFPMSPRTGFWTLWMTPQQQLWACTDGAPTKLPRGGGGGDPAPRLVGVYVDVGEGQVSFYDVANRCHLYTFALEGRSGGALRASLVPVLACMDGDTVLTVVPASADTTEFT